MISIYSMITFVYTNPIERKKKSQDYVSFKWNIHHIFHILPRAIFGYSITWRNTYEVGSSIQKRTWRVRLIMFSLKGTMHSSKLGLKPSGSLKKVCAVNGNYVEKWYLYTLFVSNTKFGWLTFFISIRVSLLISRTKYFIKESLYTWIWVGFQSNG